VISFYTTVQEVTFELLDLILDTMLPILMLRIDPFHSFG